MGLIVVAHGLTGSGKTEVANYLEEKYGVRHFHPYRFVKRQYEELLGKQIGFLDTQEGKNYPIPGNEGVTMQELMVEDFHFTRRWFPMKTALHVRRTLPMMLQYADVCCVSFRNQAETDELLAIAPNHTLVLITLSRELARAESSDVFHDEIKSRLLSAANFVFPIANDFSLTHLQVMIDEVMAYLGQR